MVKKKRNYRHEILKILNEHDRIVGFNKLCEMGNFHRTTVHTHLDNLKRSGEIIVTTFGEKTVYSIPRSDYESHFQKLFPEIIELRKKITRQKGRTRINTISRILREILVQKASIELILANFYEQDIFASQLGFLEIMKYELELRYQLYLSDLSIEISSHSRDSINSIAHKNLKTCRKIWKQNDFTHFRRL